jgi:hypothetical protein
MSEESILVVDIGSSSVKAGYSGEDMPSYVFPAAFGKSKNSEVLHHSPFRFVRFNLVLNIIVLCIFSSQLRLSRQKQLILQHLIILTRTGLIRYIEGLFKTGMKWRRCGSTLLRMCV